MVNKWIVETVLNCCSKLIEVVLIKVINKSRDNLFAEHLVHETCNIVIVHAVTNNIKASKISSKNKSCVRTVEDTNLAVLVWHNIRNNMNIDTGLLEWQSVLKSDRKSVV